MYETNKIFCTALACIALAAVAPALAMIGVGGVMLCSSLRKYFRIKRIHRKRTMIKRRPRQSVVPFPTLMVVGGLAVAGLGLIGFL